MHTKLAGPGSQVQNPHAMVDLLTDADQLEMHVVEVPA